MLTFTHTVPTQAGIMLPQVLLLVAVSGSIRASNVPNCASMRPRALLLYIALAAATPHCLSRLLNDVLDPSDDSIEHTLLSSYDGSILQQSHLNVLTAGDATTHRTLPGGVEHGARWPNGTSVQPAHHVTKGRSTLYSSNLFACLTRCSSAPPPGAPMLTQAFTCVPA